MFGRVFGGLGGGTEESGVQRAMVSPALKKFLRLFLSVCLQGMRELEPYIYAL